MATDGWKPAVYRRFRDERARPFQDLLGLLEPRPGGRAVDLGCGTGELTADLHRHLGARDTLGIDASPAMLGEAAAVAAREPGLRFVGGRIEDGIPEPGWDVIASNAALHWVPSHGALIRVLFDALAPGGQLAVQVPFNEGQPFVLAADLVANEAPFSEALGSFRRARHVLDPLTYVRALDASGFVDVRARLEVYVHHLPDREGILSWVRGAMLTQFEEPLGPVLFERFIERYRQELFAQVPEEAPLLFPFQRVFFRGTRPR